MLTDSTINVNDQNRFGRTPLHYACRNGQLQAASVLINEGHSRVDVQTNTMSTVAHECCRFGQAALLRLMLQADKEFVNTVNAFGSLPIHVACVSGSIECVQVLLKWHSSTTTRNKKGMTPLHIACENGDELLALLLLDSAPPAHLLIRDAYESLPVHHACQNNMLHVIGRMMILMEESGHLQRAMDLPDCTGTSALQYAAKNFGAEHMTISELQHEVEQCKALPERGPSSSSSLNNHTMSDMDFMSPVSAAPRSEAFPFQVLDRAPGCTHPLGEGGVFQSPMEHSGSNTPLQNAHPSPLTEFAQNPATDRCSVM
eukprot:EG_transcript_16417